MSWFPRKEVLGSSRDYPRLSGTGNLGFSLCQGTILRLPQAGCGVSLGDMLRIDELVYLYRLKASKEYGYYELVP